MKAVLALVENRNRIDNSGLEDVANFLNFISSGPSALQIEKEVIPPHCSHLEAGPETGPLTFGA